jgi:hypothetical protein
VTYVQELRAVGCTVMIQIYHLNPYSERQVKSLKLSQTNRKTGVLGVARNVGSTKTHSAQGSKPPS